MKKIKNLKQKREEMRAVAKRKETLFPYSLKWFVFFKSSPHSGGAVRGLMQALPHKQRLIDKPSFPIEKGQKAKFFVFS